MEKQILLESSRSKFSVNTPNKMGVELDGQFKLLQSDGILGNFSLFDQYNSERDECNKFRMIFVVNPVCTNALFNTQTEIIKDEGSTHPVVLGEKRLNPSEITKADGSRGNCIVNTSDVTRYQALKDTEYSHPQNGGFVYHCGLDIFNNHMLRNNGFVHVNKIGENHYEDGEERSEEVYNTIYDYLRDGDGKIVENAVNPESTEKKKLRLYQLDSILTMKRAYINRLRDDNGWLGFTNPGNIDVPNSNKKDKFGNDVLINQMLAGNKPCEFIDMYPDRSLYSFIPKYNKFRDRTEKNWDYCITYPYEKDVDMLNKVCGGLGGAIRANFDLGHNSSSVKILMCRSSFRHTLKENSRIMFYYYNGTTFTKLPVPIQVVSVGNYDGSETDRYFSIRLSDIDKIFMNNGPITGSYSDDYSEQSFQRTRGFIPENGVFFYKKVSNGGECEYYFRKYKKLKRIDTNGEEKDLRSDVNKLAFGENIYGDRVAQVVFTDDVNLEGLYDHMGRPLSEMYFTVVKRNAGRNEWYNELDYGSDKVEFSHCFGKLTSGVDFGPSSATDIDYNVRYLHNVDLECIVSEHIGIIKDVFGEVVANHDIPKKIEDDITIDNDVFYGDVVEFDPYNYTETEISPVFHRFNTEQREEVSKFNFYDVYYDRMMTDVYDPNGKFSVVKTNYSKISVDGQDIEIPANIRPEGYFYNPHSKIKVRENVEIPTRVRAKLVNFGFVSCGVAAGCKYTTLNIKAPSSYNFLKWDYIAFCDVGGIVDGVDYQPKTVWGKITDVSGVNVTLRFEGIPLGTSPQEIENVLCGSGRRYRAYYCEESVPAYAAFNKSTQEFVWKDFVSPSVMTDSMEMYDTPFANGRFYLEKNINIYVRRQDPSGDFGLSVARHTDGGNHRTNPMEYFNPDSTKLDLSQVLNFYNKLDYICY